MYVLLLITATTVGTVTVQRLGTFNDLLSCGTATAEQTRNHASVGSADGAFLEPKS
jgi:hypothetical protein